MTAKHQVVTLTENEALARAVAAYGRQNLDEAEHVCRAILEQNPDRTEAIYLLASVRSARGEHEAALAGFDRVLALSPGHANAQYNRALSLRRLRRYDEALEACNSAVALRSDDARAHYLRGALLHLTGRRAEAREAYAQAVALRADFAPARLAVCMAELPIVYADAAEISQRRAGYETALRAFCAEVDRSDDAGRFAGAIGTSQPFHLAYQGLDDRALQELYGTAVCRIMDAHFGAARLAPPARADEKIRIGFVSGCFSQHSVWKIPIRGWLSKLDRTRFRLFGYHTGAGRDLATADAAAMCERFVTGPLPLADWRREILADAPHVLIYPEIGMDGTTIGLAAQRLAAVQCNGAGHPVTSGLPTVDFFLSSDLMEPPDGERHYTEQLVRLPNLAIYYEPLEPPPLPVTRAELGMRDSATVYWCGQATFKFLPQYDALFARIAAAAGDCQFAFIESPDSPQITALFRARLERAFSRVGLDWSAYCVILPRLDMRQFVAATGLCDVFLDPVGWSGCNTLLESLAHNLPIVTLPGSLMRARHGVAILAMMGLTTTTARSLDEYVALAARLARDLPWRHEIKAAVAKGKHRLYRDPIAIGALEQFLEQVGRGGRPGRT